MIFTREYHIISDASIVNNCIIFTFSEEDIYDPTISLLLRTMKLPAFIQKMLAPLVNLFAGVSLDF